MGSILSDSYFYLSLECLEKQQNKKKQGDSIQFPKESNKIYPVLCLFYLGQIKFAIKCEATTVVSSIKGFAF